MSPSKPIPLFVAVLAAALALTGCQPEPSEPAATVASTADAPSPNLSSAPASAPAPAPATASPTPTADAALLPGSCDEIYSPRMRATLEEQNPPLNDPGVTLLSTQEAGLLEILDSAPTLRCSWGVPSDSGLSTNVTVLDAARASAVAGDLAAAGFGCEESDGATVCRVEQRGVSLEDVEYVRGETHAMRGGHWVATSWLNFSPDGYTEDILATLATLAALD